MLVLRYISNSAVCQSSYPSIAPRSRCLAHFLRVVTKRQKREEFDLSIPERCRMQSSHQKSSITSSTSCRTNGRHSSSAVSSPDYGLHAYENTFLPISAIPPTLSSYGTTPFRILRILLHPMSGSLRSTAIQEIWREPVIGLGPFLVS